MYYGSLKEFEAYLNGHQMAFFQLGAIAAGDSFHSTFVDWLFETAKVSGAAGWYCALEQLAEREKKSEEELFQTLAPEFLAGWGK